MSDREATIRIDVDGEPVEALFAPPPN